METVKALKTLALTERRDCVIEEWPNGVIIGQDLHMNGLDAPAFLQWSEVEVLMDLLGSIVAEKRSELYRVK